MFLRMVPAEWLKKILLKSIQVFAETLLKQAEKQPLQDGETDYNYFLIARRDKETQKPKLLIFHTAGNFAKAPYTIHRTVWAYNVEQKIETINFEEYKQKIKASLKDGSLEKGLQEIEKA